MRTSPKTIQRREHWRWQRCGPGRCELRRVFVRGTAVTLGPDVDGRQDDLLDGRRGGVPGRRGAHRAGARPIHPIVDERPVLRSYWRRQPYGPGLAMRRVMLIDVRA